MLIPHGYEPSEEEKYKSMVLMRLKKAKHLAERIALFKNDVSKSNLKSGDKTKILELLKLS